MSNLSQYAVPIVIVILILYRRIRRSVGFQPLRPRRLQVRIGIFALIGLLLLYTGFVHPIVFAADGVGLACGALLAWFAIRHSRFEQRGTELYYRTHIVIESVVIALFAGRIAYRFLFVMKQTQDTVANNSDTLQQYGRDPWTAAIFFLLIAYYAGYYMYILRSAQRQPA